MALVAVALLAGCAKAPIVPPPPPVVVSIDLSATPQVNPDVDGRASPIVIRVYELPDAGAFSEADFFALWNQESQVLASTPAKRHEFILAPGGSAASELKLEPSVQQIGIAAAYRDIRGATWRALVPVSQDPQGPRHIHMAIRADAKALSAQIVNKEAPGAAQ